MSEGHAWAPQRAVFVRRSLILGAVTFVIFLALTLFVTMGIWHYLVISAVLTLILFMEDFIRWRQVRDERWQIVDGQLIHDGTDGRAAIPLSEITSVKRRLGNAVVIELRSNQRIMMRYLAVPAQIVDHINTARPPGAP